MKKVLVADIGGTNARFAVSDGRKFIWRKTYSSKQFKPRQLLKRVLREAPVFSSAIIAVAGPVVNGRCRVTNIPWTLSERALSRQLGVRVILLNDFEAIAYGVKVAKKIVLKQGTRQQGLVAVLGAGTGLGEAVTIDGRVIATEGGHADFAANTKAEWALKQFVVKKQGYCDVESVLSGRGLETIYTFFTRKKASATEITRMDHKQTLKLFTGIYASEARNLALKAGATGGVVIVGTIANALRSWLKSKMFRHNFERQPMKKLVSEIPVYLILDENIGLKGCVEYYAQLPRLRT